MQKSENLQNAQFWEFMVLVIDESYNSRIMWFGDSYDSGESRTRIFDLLSQNPNHESESLIHQIKKSNHGSESSRLQSNESESHPESLNQKTPNPNHIPNPTYINSRIPNHIPNHSFTSFFPLISIFEWNFYVIRSHSVQKVCVLYLNDDHPNHKSNIFR